MRTVYSPRHAGHSGQVELSEGALVPAFEKPSRAKFVLEQVNAAGLGEVAGPDVHSLETAAKVHRPDYLDFLPTVWDRWTAEGRSGTALPFCWPTRGLRGDMRPDFIDSSTSSNTAFSAPPASIVASNSAAKSSPITTSRATRSTTTSTPTGSCGCTTSMVGTIWRCAGSGRCSTSKGGPPSRS